MAIGSPGQFANLYRTKQNVFAFLDIYGVSKEQQKQFYDDIQSAVNQMQSPDGKVTLSDGTVVDIHSLSGMTVFQVHLQFMNANLEFVNNTFTFVKNLESKLDNMLAG